MPGRARRQRTLIDLLQASVEPFLERYVRNDRLIWRATYPATRDGADDFYEATRNWPLLYLLAGNPQLLEHSQRLWDGITRQLTELGGSTRSTNAATTSSTRAKATSISTSSVWRIPPTNGTGRAPGASPGSI